MRSVSGVSFPASITPIEYKKFHKSIQKVLFYLRGKGIFEEDIADCRQYMTDNRMVIHSINTAIEKNRP